MDVIERREKTGVFYALAQNVERLHQRQSRSQQRGKLLVEHQEFTGLDPTPPREGDTRPKPPAFPADREDVETQGLQFLSSLQLAVGDVDLFDDFAGVGAEPATKLHSVSTRVAAEPYGVGDGQRSRVSTSRHEIIAVDRGTVRSPAL